MSSHDSSQQPDGVLRGALRTSLTAPPSPVEQATLDTLQNRILAEWAARQPASVAMGSVATSASTGFLSRVLGRFNSQWQLQLGFAALAFMVLMAVQITQSGREPNIDDLLEPDVLALMAMGEL